jgi:hypothetical protein
MADIENKALGSYIDDRSHNEHSRIDHLEFFFHKPNDNPAPITVSRIWCGA